ncbi:hypothetical protein MTP99_018148 [Tenebrio molitor]|jgi:hypothetical protein|nr:hypothetical protein MTP99_018148 [Tenebrio molitor]
MTRPNSEESHFVLDHRTCEIQKSLDLFRQPEVHTARFATIDNFVAFALAKYSRKLDFFPPTRKIRQDSNPTDLSVAWYATIEECRLTTSQQICLFYLP